jgi:hypothetical protein
MQESEAARAFVVGLVEQKFPNGLDEEVKQQLVNDLLQCLEDQLNRLILNSLNDAQVAKMENLIDTNQVDKIQDFLYKEGINVQSLVARVMAEFQASYLEA